MNGAYITAAGQPVSNKITPTNKNKLQTPSGGAQASYTAYRKHMQKVKQWEAMLQLKQAYDDSMAELNREETELAQGYQAARNQAVGSHEQEGRNFAEYAAASGLNSGTVAQVGQAREGILHKEMAADHADRGAVMADLAQRRAAVETEYKAAIEQAGYTGEHELAQALYKEMVRARKALMAAEIRQRQQELEQYRALQAAAEQNGSKK